MHYIPWPVIAGFTTGIAVIIFLQQAPGLLGVEKVDGEGILPVTWHTIEGYLDNPGVVSLILGGLTVAVMVGWMRIPRIREIPASMAALLIGTFVSLLPAFEGVASPECRGGCRHRRSRHSIWCRLPISYASDSLWRYWRLSRACCLRWSRMG